MLMKQIKIRLNVLLLAIFATLTASQGFAIKVGPAPNKARLQKLREQQAKDSPVRRGTRGVDRGQTRSIPGSRSRDCSQPLLPILPVYVQDFDIAFARQKEGELRIPYGRDQDSNAFHFFAADRYEGHGKIEIQKRLGFVWQSLTEPPTRSPGWIEMAGHYRELLAEQKIEAANFIVPAIVLYREVSGKKEYLLIDPFKDPFPLESEGYKVLTSEVEFNLPFSVIAAGLASGKFPLLDAVHDVSHFVAFVRYPEFTKAIVSRFRETKKEEFTSGFKRRQYWLTEALSLPDPSSLASTTEFLKRNGRPLNPKSTRELNDSLSKWKESDLLNYALEIADRLESTLLDVSGGSSSSPEKYFYLSEAIGLRADAVTSGELQTDAKLFAIVQLSDTLFKDQAVTFNGNPKPITNETGVFNFQILASGLHYLAQVLRTADDAKLAQVFADPTGRLVTFADASSVSNPKLKPGARAELTEILKSFLCASEYVLLKSPQFQPQDWVNAFLTPELALDHPLSQMLMQAFPNSIMRNYYLGVGLKRP